MEAENWRLKFEAIGTVLTNHGCNHPEVCLPSTICWMTAAVVFEWTNVLRKISQNKTLYTTRLDTSKNTLFPLLHCFLFRLAGTVIRTWLLRWPWRYHSRLVRKLRSFTSGMFGISGLSSALPSEAMLLLLLLPSLSFSQANVLTLTGRFGWFRDLIGHATWMPLMWLPLKVL